MSTPMLVFSLIVRCQRVLAFKPFSLFLILSTRKKQTTFTGASWQGGHGPSYLFEIVGFSEIFNLSSENLRTFTVGKDKGLEFYREIF